MSPPSPLAALDYALLQQCMHCGLCLPSCPTYASTGREKHSPRGRIALMRAIADGDLATTPAFADEMSFCLGCLACTTACPAGVDYASLLGAARAQAETATTVHPRISWRRATRWLVLAQLFTRPRLLRAVGRLLGLYQRLGLQSLFRRLGGPRLLPHRLRAAEPSTPTMCRHFSDTLIAPVELPANETPRHRVALLTGCVQDLAFSDVNRATVDVLLAHGCEVVTPRLQHCCGSLHAHNGEPELARSLARRQLEQIDPTQFDAIISNAAGCGSHLKHYDRLLADDPAYAARAAIWSRKVRDISEWLVEIGLRRPAPPPDSPPTPLPITYHEACHLCHGQRISDQPRALLTAIPGVELRECAEATWCCGSAGIYSLTQPEMAAQLRSRKLGHLRATGCETVAVANPGCQLHLQADLSSTDSKTPRFVHPVILLAKAYADARRPAANAGMTPSPLPPRKPAQALNGGSDKP